MNDVAKEIFGFITELCDYILKFTKLLVKCEKKTICTDLLKVGVQVQFFACSDVVNVYHFFVDGREHVAIVVENTLWTHTHSLFHSQILYSFRKNNTNEFIYINILF